MRTYKKLGFAPSVGDWVYYINRAETSRCGGNDGSLSDIERPATCQEITDAGGDIPVVGDWVVRTDYEGPYKIWQIDRINEFQHEVVYFNDTGFRINASDIRPAHASEIPEPDFKIGDVVKWTDGNIYQLVQGDKENDFNFKVVENLDLDGRPNVPIVSILLDWNRTIDVINEYATFIRHEPIDTHQFQVGDKVMFKDALPNMTSQNHIDTHAKYKGVECTIIAIQRSGLIEIDKTCSLNKYTLMWGSDELLLYKPQESKPKAKRRIQLRKKNMPKKPKTKKVDLAKVYPDTKNKRDALNAIKQFDDETSEVIDLSQQYGERLVSLIKNGFTREEAVQIITQRGLE